jgi:hypothetical protein
MRGIVGNFRNWWSEKALARINERGKAHGDFIPMNG